MDFPTAWTIAGRVEPDYHHTRCSYRSGMLCDCDVLLKSPEYLADYPGPTPDDEDREALRLAVGAVLFNASNYPQAVQARLLGQDTRPLTEKVVDAVLAVRRGSPVVAPPPGR